MDYPLKTVSVICGVLACGIGSGDNKEAPVPQVLCQQRVKIHAEWQCLVSRILVTLACRAVVNQSTRPLKEHAIARKVCCPPNDQKYV